MGVDYVTELRKLHILNGLMTETNSQNQSINGSRHHISTNFITFIFNYYMF